MRIISKFHDYYDVVQREGQDLNLIYNRECHVEDAKIFLPTLGGPEPNDSSCYYRTRYNTDKFNFGYRDFAIGFCGKVYCVVCIYHGEEKTYCYNAQEAEDAILAVADKKTTEFYTGKRKWRGLGSLMNREVLDRHFLRYKEEFQDKYVNHFLETRTPIFVSRWTGWWLKNNQEITYNEQIGQYKFAKIFDPYRAFQEIQMFLGGLAQPEKQIPAMNDKDMAFIKGFDKWSFRKEPKEKK